MSDTRKIEGTHELLVVEGPDARKFLNGLLSQDLDQIQPDRAVRSFLLGPKGKLRALLWVYGKDGWVGLVTDAGIGDRVADDLNHFKIRVKVTIHRPVPLTTVVGNLPEGAVAAPMGNVERGFVDGPVAAPFMSRQEWETLRVEAREPVMDRDVDESAIPHETGLVEQSVSFEKGCYLGQELVARMDSRGGKANHLLRRLALEGPVEAAAEVRSGPDVVGKVTTAGFSIARSAHIGLGLVHRSIEPGAPVTIGPVAGVVED
jgi:folate-binding protein YgfZ